MGMDLSVNTGWALIPDGADIECIYSEDEPWSSFGEVTGDDKNDWDIRELLESNGIETRCCGCYDYVVPIPFYKPLPREQGAEVSDRNGSIHDEAAKRDAAIKAFKWYCNKVGLGYSKMRVGYFSLACYW